MVSRYVSQVDKKRLEYIALLLHEAEAQETHVEARSQFILWASNGRMISSKSKLRGWTEREVDELVELLIS